MFSVSDARSYEFSGRKSLEELSGSVVGEMKRTSPASLRILTAGEHAEFEELLIKHLDSLYNVALHLTRSKDEAEDLVQETSLKAFRGFDQLEELWNARSWFLTILFNVFRNSYKRRKRAPFVDVELTEELLASASTKSYDQEKIFGSLMEDEVQQALADLPPEFQSVIILSDLEECSHREMAEILGCPMGTVASRLFRGRQLLRESLEAYAKRRGLL